MVPTADAILGLVGGYLLELEQAQWGGTHPLEEIQSGRLSNKSSTAQGSTRRQNHGHRILWEPLTREAELTHRMLSAVESLDPQYSTVLKKTAAGEKLNGQARKFAPAIAASQMFLITLQR